MGWLWPAMIGAAAFAVLWLAGVARGLWTFIASALMLGAAGYAWQQHATLAGHPVAADSRPIEVQPGLVSFRSAIMPGKPGDDAALAAADDRLRDGDTAAAGQAMLDAIARNPGDAALWAGLGTAVAVHDGGQVSPTALFAFRHAMDLAPDQPGPPFFLGLAYAQVGDLAAARPLWQRALALTPPGASYRIDLTRQLAMIDDALGANPGAPPAR
jgi:hypothetical protein